MTGYQRVCAVDDVPEEGAVAVDVDGIDVAVVRSAGELYAVRDECSHAQIALSEGDVGGGEVECWLHGSRFDLRTGKPTGLPATEPVPVYPCLVADGSVMVDVHNPSNFSN